MGVLLYELLTGSLPVEIEPGTPVAAILVQRANQADETPKPSSRVGTDQVSSDLAAKMRGLDPRALQRKLKGELDWIALQALEQDPERRYGSAGEFADDIEAFLAHQPLKAGPVDLSYRFRKYIRRNRGPGHLGYCDRHDAHRRHGALDEQRE